MRERMLIPFLLSIQSIQFFLIDKIKNLFYRFYFKRINQKPKLIELCVRNNIERACGNEY